MFYIKGKHINNKWIVADTDSDDEEIHTYNEIKQAFLKYGIDIKGVSRYKNYNSIDIEVYAPNYSTKAVKQNMLNGIDIRVNNGVLGRLEINLNSNFSSNPLRIKLSDYCTSLGKGFLQISNRGVSNNHKIVILEFDDNIDFLVSSFSYSGLDYSPGIKVDTTKITNKKYLERIYKVILNGGSNYNNTDRFNQIIDDNKVRLNKFYIKNLIEYGCGLSDSVIDVGKNFLRSLSNEDYNLCFKYISNYMKRIFDKYSDGSSIVKLLDEYRNFGWIHSYGGKPQVYYAEEYKSLIRDLNFETMNKFLVRVSKNNDISMMYRFVFIFDSLDKYKSILEQTVKREYKYLVKLEEDIRRKFY